MKSTAVVFAAAVALGLSACADTAGQGAIDAKYAVIGMPKAELLACAGAPERHAVADGKEFFTYTARRVETRGGWGAGGWGGGGWGHYGFYGTPVYDSYARTCTVTFTLIGDKVAQTTYGGDSTGGVQPGLCWPVVGNCLDAAQRLRGMTPPRQ